MKLAIVSPFPPSKGTLNEYAYHLVKSFGRKEEIDSIIIITDKLPEGQTYVSEPDMGDVTFEPVWEFNSMSSAAKIVAAIKKHQPDIVLYNIQFLSFGDKKIPATVGLFSPVMSKLSGIPSVVILHNIIETVDFEEAGITNNAVLKGIYNITGAILTRTILQANLVTLTIPKYVKIIRDKYKVDNVVLIPHGTFEVPPQPDFNRGTDKLNVMTFGKFGTYKKVEAMIDAVIKVRHRTGKAIHITIAGTDNPNVKGYLAGVAKHYKDLPDITFTGYVEEEDVPDIFGDCTLCVFPYTSTTGSSGVLHQAGSYGKAVALPLLGDLKELVEEEGYEGAYFQPDDAESMADAIEEIIVDDNYRDHLAKKNYAAASSLPMSEIADWYLSHFEILLNRIS